MCAMSIRIEHFRWFKSKFSNCSTIKCQCWWSQWSDLLSSILWSTSTWTSLARTFASTGWSSFRIDRLRNNWLFHYRQGLFLFQSVEWSICSMFALFGQSRFIDSIESHFVEQMFTITLCDWLSFFNVSSSWTRSLHHQNSQRQRFDLSRLDSTESNALRWYISGWFNSIECNEFSSNTKDSFHACHIDRTEIIRRMETRFFRQYTAGQFIISRTSFTSIRRGIKHISACFQ